ncbi:glutathione S-transferase family protein [Altericroceibacterium endophyticum]|uniref:Glutathione S-transferase n=1 Tax=Altericroceibacterium endophyticum TaxID=1808508 RepID=A0A6I4T2N9_9SPHN|nr:glutathione S-transferase N-terminal domain-containing protein [Altericroceibacterium endophyticum]MXO64409.1 glutathione S-transferase [Altericroceibacterium endophyticum]
MDKLSAFPITQRWKPKNSDILQLFGCPTPNGMKPMIALEELGIDYEYHHIDISKDETFTPEFESLNPNGKIPAIIDPDGPDGEPIGMFESNAILIYLADKKNALIPQNIRERLECTSWLFFQAAHIGPFMGNLGYFYKYAGREIEDPRPVERFAKESERLLNVLEKRLDGREWIMGDQYTIADISMAGWIGGVISWYEAGPIVGWDKLSAVPAWLERNQQRPAMQRLRERAAG